MLYCCINVTQYGNVHLRLFGIFETDMHFPVSLWQYPSKCVEKMKNQGPLSKSDK